MESGNTWNEQEERTRISHHSYDGYLHAAITKLLPKLPFPHPERADIFQDFLGFALEAVILYDPNRGAQFATFLTKHLYIRSLQWHNYAWLARNCPKFWVIHFSDLSHNQDDKSFGVNEDTVSNVDPTSINDRTCVFSAQLNELREELSPRALQLFDYFSEYIAWEELCNTEKVIEGFQSTDAIRRLSDLTGLPRWEVYEFLNEIHKKAWRFLEVAK